MSSRHRSILPASLVLAFAMAAPLAAEAQGREPDPADRPSEHRALSDAVRRVERATNGQVLSAERVQFDGRDVNRVKIIDDRGRVRVYWDDPQSRRRDREDEGRERNDNARSDRDRPARNDAPPRRTRRHDGPAFNL